VEYFIPHCYNGMLKRFVCLRFRFAYPMLANVFCFN